MIIYHEHEIASVRYRMSELFIPFSNIANDLGI